MSAPESKAFYRICSLFPSGAVIVAGTDPEEGPYAFTASSFCAASFEPPMVSVNVAHASSGPRRLRRGARFSMAILREDQEELARQCGIAGPARPTEPVTDGVAHMSCEVVNFVDAGSHRIIIAAVQELEERGGKPLVYWRRAFFRLHLDYPFLESAEVLDEFVTAWERGTLAGKAWTHSAHVAATAYYAFDRSEEDVFGAMKRGILYFNTSVGGVNGPDSGYHETLTRFWTGVIVEFVRKTGAASRIEAAREAVRVFGEDRDLHRMYYGFDVVRDRRARREWVAPDLANDYFG